MTRFNGGALFSVWSIWQTKMDKLMKTGTIQKINEHSRTTSVPSDLKCEKSKSDRDSENSLKRKIKYTANV
jgi:hypothetical protein